MAGNFPTPQLSRISEGDTTSHDQSHDLEEPLPQSHDQKFLSRNIVAVAPEIQAPPTSDLGATDPDIVATASKLVKNVLAKVIAEEVLRTPTGPTYSEV